MFSSFSVANVVVVVVVAVVVNVAVDDIIIADVIIKAKPKRKSSQPEHGTKAFGVTDLYTAKQNQLYKKGPSH